MDWPVHLFIIVILSQSEAIQFEIGIRSKVTNSYVPVTNCSGQVTKKSGDSFEVYCSREDDFTDCIWDLPQSQEPCRLLGGIQQGECPAKLRKESRKCVASIDSFQPNLHQGAWSCILLSYNGGINITDPLSINLVALREAIPVVEQPSITLKENQMQEVKCSSTNAIFGPQQNDRIFGWSINGNIYFNNDHGVVNETKRNCATKSSFRLYDELCYYDSTLNYRAYEGDTILECFSTQTDSFGAVVIGNSATVEVTVVSEKIGVLSTEAKIGIALAVVIPLVLIIIVIILAFCFGWCCFKGRRKQEKPKLEVSDEPKGQQPYVIHYDDQRQPRFQKWPTQNVGPPAPLAVMPYDFERILNLPDPYADQCSDELLVYRWEGFGRSVSAATSFSSLESLEPDRDWSSTLRSYGPRFSQLADMASGKQTQSSDSNSSSSVEDEEVTDATSTSHEGEYEFQPQTPPDTWV